MRRRISVLLSTAALLVVLLAFGVASLISAHATYHSAVADTMSPNISSVEY